jgi:hypothetical protein
MLIYEDGSHIRANSGGNAMVQVTAEGGGIAGLTGAQREGIAFRSGTDDCAAWHYRGSNGA